MSNNAECCESLKHLSCVCVSNTTHVLVTFQVVPYAEPQVRMRRPRVFKYKSPTTINIPLSDRSVLRSGTSCYTDTRKIYTAKNETSLFSQTPGLLCHTEFDPESY